MSRPFRLGGITAGLVLMAFGVGDIALNTSFFASQVGLFAIVMGLALLLSGVGILVLALGLLERVGLRRDKSSAPPSAAVPAAG